MNQLVQGLALVDNFIYQRPQLGVDMVRSGNGNAVGISNLPHEQYGAAQRIQKAGRQHAGGLDAGHGRAKKQQNHNRQQRQEMGINRFPFHAEAQNRPVRHFFRHII